ncbi:MAG TPA: L-histidine N(alpha)-methyltransferase [Longimicrobiales bacterium]
MNAGRLDAMRAEVRAGLEARPRIIPPKFFYDERGSELFEEITRLPEYYPTRTERGILQTQVADWMRSLAPRALIELGAGSGEKTRILLDAMLAATPSGVTYVPVDVSAEFLRTAAERLSQDYPRLRVEPLVADLNDDFDVPATLPRPLVVAFLGSTIGNFGRVDAARLLGRAARAVGEHDRLLLGVDLRKDSALLHAAYNDRAGVTAEFNRNVLSVLNRQLGADFDVDAWRHDARYDERNGRIEMYLVSERPQRVSIPHVGTFDFDAGESILTEISRKYDRPEVEATLEDAGLKLESWFEAEPGYAVAAATAVDGRR